MTLWGAYMSRADLSSRARIVAGSGKAAGLNIFRMVFHLWTNPVPSDIRHDRYNHRRLEKKKQRKRKFPVYFTYSIGLAADWGCGYLIARFA